MANGILIDCALELSMRIASSMKVKKIRNKNRRCNQANPSSMSLAQLLCLANSSLYPDCPDCPGEQFQAAGASKHEDPAGIFAQKHT
jgi:hypothetical protein